MTKGGICMNKFQKQVKKRTKKALEIIGLGDTTYRSFISCVRIKLKEDIKIGSALL